MQTATVSARSAGTAVRLAPGSRPSSILGSTLGLAMGLGLAHCWRARPWPRDPPPKRTSWPARPKRTTPGASPASTRQSRRSAPSQRPRSQALHRQLPPRCSRGTALQGGAIRPAGRPQGRKSQEGSGTGRTEGIARHGHEGGHKAVWRAGGDARKRPGLVRDPGQLGHPREDRRPGHDPARRPGLVLGRGPERPFQQGHQRPLTAAPGATPVGILRSCCQVVRRPRCIKATGG